ncbi:MAG: hypothetical protein AAB296_04785 [Candidatus Desantisbacteria bacterium]
MRRIIILAGTLCIIAGCITHAKLAFHCDDNINQGLLLPVDIILISKGEEKNVLQIGYDAWFESEYRNNLPDTKLIKLALNNKEMRKVNIDVSQKNEMIIIFADYRDALEQDAQQIIIYPQKWRMKGAVRVGEKGLSIDR